MKSTFLVLLICFAHSAGSVELTETRATQLFIEKNLELAATKYEIELARAQEITAGLWRNPFLVVDSQLNPYGKNWNQQNTGGPTQQDAILTVPVDVNGKRRQAVRVARLATRVKEAEFAAFLRNNVFIMLETLYNLQRLKNEHELLEEKAQLLEKLRITLEKRIGSPTNQPLIQNRAKLAAESVKVEIEQNRIEQNAEENKLRTLLLLDFQENIHLQVNFKNGLTETLDRETLVENAKNNRPDFLGLKVFKEQLEGQLELDHRQIWDDIGLQAGLSHQNRVDQRPGDSQSRNYPGAWSWMVGVTIPIPVFDRNQGNILRTRLLSNQVLVRERLMGEVLSKDVASSIHKLEVINLNLRRYKTVQLPSAKTVRDAALRQFGTGSTTLIEYLDAVNAYNDTISKYINAQSELTTEYLRLKLISGKEIGL